MIVNFIIDLVTVMFCPCPLFLTMKEAVQQYIRSICLSFCRSVCAPLEILLLKGSNQQIRAQTDGLSLFTPVHFRFHNLIK